MAILPTAIVGYVGYNIGKQIILDETKEFALWNWNYDPYKYYLDTPLFPDVHPTKNSYKKIFVKTPRDYTEQVSLSRGGSKYYVYIFPNDKVKKVEFDNRAMNTNEDNKKGLQAIYKVGDAWYYEDWSSLEKRTFCRDLDEENISAIVVMASNADLNSDAFGDIELMAEKKCNSGWRGTIRVNWSSKQLTGASTINIDRGSYTINEELKYDSKNDTFEAKNSNFSGKYYGLSRYIAPRADFCTLWEIQETNTYGAGNYDYINKDEDISNVRMGADEVYKPGTIGGTYSLGFGILPPPHKSDNPNPFKTTSFSSIMKRNCSFILSLPNWSGLSENSSQSTGGFGYIPNGVTVQIEPDTKRIKGSDKFEISPGVFGTADWDYQRIE